MGKIKEFIKTNPSLRFFYRGLKYWKDKFYGSFHAKQVYKQSKRALYKQLHPSKAVLGKESSVTLSKQPSFTVVVSISAYSGHLPLLVNSLLAQTYQKWELILVPRLPDSLLFDSFQKIAGEDTRIRLLETAGGVKALVAKGLGSYVAFLEEKSSLHPSALFQIVKALNDRDTDYIYTDSCLIEGNHYTPHYKPDFAPDTLRSMNYIGGFGVVAETLLTSLDDSWDIGDLYDLWFRCTEKASNVYHIPEVLHYGHHQEGAVSSSSLQAVADHLQRLERKGTASFDPSSQVLKISYEIIGNPLVSIIIPNKDHISELQPCIESILDKSTYRNFEIMIVENNSTKQETFAYYEKLKKTHTNIHIVVWEGVFNYAAINNFGVGHCKGEHLLFLNNDTTVITPSWIEEMLMYSQREDIGLVGGMLYYPDDTIQHAGLVVGVDAGSQSYAEHLYRGLPKGNPGYSSDLLRVRNVSALTGACLMTSRKAFTQCNGFDEDFAVQFNDIDLCLKAMSLGMVNVFTPYAQLYHYESKSRPLDDSSASQLSRYYKARDDFYGKWKSVLDGDDPYFNKNLHISLEKYTFLF